MRGSMQPQIMTVHDLFAGSVFKVPDYQRAYAWEEKQWTDLWEDIREGMRTGTTHFLGTVVLMEQEEPEYDSEGRPLRVFDVVDGQQRLTTLSLLLLALYGPVREGNARRAEGIWRDFIEHEPDVLKLRLGGLNGEYFRSLVTAVANKGDPPKAQRSSNARLRNAVRTLTDLIIAWLRDEDASTDITDLAKYIREKIEVLRFVTESRPLAIKTFQTVNDRGKELSLLDKTKSFLMFYLTRYLQEDPKSFHTVEETFGQVFDNYDAARDLAEKHNVVYLINPRYRFNEDELLRFAYHYGSKDLGSKFCLETEYNYDITPERIFEDFIKRGSRQLRDNPTQLRAFILACCDDLLKVSQALVRLLEQIEESDSHKRLFQFQNPSAIVYPLIVATEARGICDTEMLQAISILDLRIYQVRGTDPKADLYRNAFEKIKPGNRQAVLKAILDYCQAFGNDQELNSYLQGHVFKQGFTKYVIWNFLVESDKEKEVDELDYELFSRCQVDHILAQDTSTFDATSYGFESDEDYELTKHGFGNLTVLEDRLNRRALNRPPSEKASIYADSRLTENRVLGMQIRESGFRREQQIARTNAIVEFFKKKWAIPDPIPPRQASENAAYSSGHCDDD